MAIANAILIFRLMRLELIDVENDAKEELKKILES
jgi:hypothetical protein